MVSYGTMCRNELILSIAGDESSCAVLLKCALCSICCSGRLQKHINALNRSYNREIQQTKMQVGLL